MSFVAVLAGSEKRIYLWGILAWELRYLLSPERFTQKRVFFLLSVTSGTWKYFPKSVILKMEKLGEIIAGRLPLENKLIPGWQKVRQLSIIPRKTQASGLSESPLLSTEKNKIKRGSLPPSTENRVIACRVLLSQMLTDERVVRLHLMQSRKWKCIYSLEESSSIYFLLPRRRPRALYRREINSAGCSLESASENAMKFTFSFLRHCSEARNQILARG